MYIIRDIFQLKYGHFKDAKTLLDDAIKKDIMPKTSNIRVLSDFTGDAYRLIFEEGYETLAAYEENLTDSMGKEEWQKWYQQFKPHIETSHREILKQVI